VGAGTRTGANEQTAASITQEGSVVGTLHYMAPEQVQGKATDARADIFSFGCLFYEMLTGKRAFDGVNAPSVIGAILERPAPSIERLRQQCSIECCANVWRKIRSCAGKMRAI